MLTIVATPIGNLKDITLRALEALQSCDAIVCEDTRRTSILLNHYQIKKPLLVLNDFNETKTFPLILHRLIQGENLCLVSDAGTPLISDPGYKLVRECIFQGIKIDSIPGACSPIDALTLSSLPPDKFMFLGYLPEKQGNRNKMYDFIRSVKALQSITCILFVAPHKLQKTVKEMNDFFQDPDLVLATELTKLHQTVKKQTATQWLNEFKSQPPKGEYILLF
jgi:16S rRNA (cytidine1402-2'-O)-methyltransferase